jgi:hypothetical protein
VPSQLTNVPAKFSAHKERATNTISEYARANPKVINAAAKKLDNEIPWLTRWKDSRNDLFDKLSEEDKEQYEDDAKCRNDARGKLPPKEQVFECVSFFSDLKLHMRLTQYIQIPATHGGRYLHTASPASWL